MRVCAKDKFTGAKIAKAEVIMRISQKTLSFDGVRVIAKNYRNTFMMMIGSVIVFGYPLFLYVINDIPSPRDLSYERGVILNAQSNRPNLTVRGLDGEVKYYNFPYDLRSYYGRQQGAFVKIKILNKLSACRAIIGAHKVIIPLGGNDEWVWDIRCREQPYGYEEIVQNYDRERFVILFFEIFQAFVNFLILYAIYFGDRKRINDMTKAGEDK